MAVNSFFYTVCDRVSEKFANEKTIGTYPNIDFVDMYFVYF